MEASSQLPSPSGNVLVVARVRPLNRSEMERGSKCCLEFANDKQGVTINMASETSSAFGQNRFAFDRVFDMSSTQREVYD